MFTPIKNHLINTFDFTENQFVNIIDGVQLGIDDFTINIYKQDNEDKFYWTLGEAVAGQILGQDIKMGCLPMTADDLWICTRICEAIDNFQS